MKDVSNGISFVIGTDRWTILHKIYFDNVSKKIRIKINENLRLKIEVQIDLLHQRIMQKFESVTDNSN